MFVKAVVDLVKVYRMILHKVVDKSVLLWMSDMSEEKFGRIEEGGFEGVL